MQTEEIQRAAVDILRAEADHHDTGDDSDILGREHIAFLIDHDGDTLRRNRAEEVNFQAADNGQRNAVDDADERSEAGNDHRDDGGRNQHRNAEHAGNRHGADVFAVIGAGRAAD